MEKVMETINTLATVGIFIVAWFQLHSMRKEAKRERTLNICFAYDSDPVISSVVEKYRTEQSLSEHDKKTILNYFDVLAIGVAQKSYEFEIIYPQFKNIISETVSSIKIDNFESLYPDLQNLMNKISTKKRNENSA